MKKIALCSANFGGLDIPDPIPEQDMAFDYFCYGENGLALDLPQHWDDRKKSKYPKMQSHILLADYDIHIWKDASVKITSPHFISTFVNMLEGHDAVVTSHPDRKNVYDEFEFMLKKIGAGDNYLCSRFSKEEIQTQKFFFNSHAFPDKFPLFSAGIHARRNDDKTNRQWDEWYRLTLGYGNYDQCFYSYIIQKAALKYNVLPFHNPHFKVHSHKHELVPR